MTLIEELKFRGFLNQCTNEATLNEIINAIVNNDKKMINQNCILVLMDYKIFLLKD